MISYKDIKKGYYEDLLEKLYDWRNEHEEKEFTSFTLKFFKGPFSELPTLIEQWKRSKNQMVLFRGKAGMGKTHYVCATAERLCKKMNVYLLFG